MAQPPLRALIIGSGVAGLSTASQLSRATSRTLKIKILSCSCRYWTVLRIGPRGVYHLQRPTWLEGFSPELLLVRCDILEARAGRSDTSASQKLSLMQDRWPWKTFYFERLRHTRFESCAKTR